MLSSSPVSKAERSEPRITHPLRVPVKIGRFVALWLHVSPDVPP
jgi:hypothetical protein